MTQLLTAPVGLPEEPQPRRWTRDEFHQMATLGLFQGQRAELIEGEIMVLSPQGPRHYAALKRVSRVLGVLLGARFDIRPQGPLGLGEHSEPEPDIAVVEPSPDEYASAHPQSAVLVVEVSDTTLASDRARKASLYARAGIADYWIVNLVHNRVEVFRDPTPDQTQVYGFRYATVTSKPPTGSIAPLADPSLTVAVNDLLP